MIPNEIERRTIYTILSKPVQRWQFLLGKYLGAVLALGLMMALMTVVILGVRDETIDVPTLGRTPTKAVRWRMTFPAAQGDPLVQASTGHLIAQEGEWRWTLTRGSLESFKQRNVKPAHSASFKTKSLYSVLRAGKYEIKALNSPTKISRSERR